MSNIPPAQFVQFLLVVGSHLGRLPQVLVKLLQGDLVVRALVLHHLHLPHHVVGALRGDGQLGDSVGQGGLGLHGLLLHQHDAPGQGSDVGLNLITRKVFLLQSVKKGDS